MFQNFTDRFRKAMILAGDEGRRFNHKYIGTEHILLGLVGEDGGVAVKVLRDLGVDLNGIRAETEKLMMPEPGPAMTAPLPLTPCAKRVADFAHEEACELGQNYVGTEHLLLGLLREHEGVAAKVLANRGADAEKVKGEIRKLLGMGGAGTSP